MEAVQQAFRGVDLIRIMIVASVLLGAASGFYYLASRLSMPEMALLYSELDPGDAGRIVSKVENMNVPVEVRGGGTQVYVPADKVSRLRMEMAEVGLPRGGSIGYEIFDRNESLGTSSFVQEINHLRALEGEIARTIASISQVSSARVHLVLPKRKLFSRERDNPTASIVLNLSGPGRLPTSKVQSIQQMVAAAVPGLAPEHVSIVDGRGNLLARGDNDSEAYAVSNLEEKRVGLEMRLSRTIENLLEKHVGYGKVRAEVSVEIDSERITENSEIFDPEGQVVRSSQSVTQKENSTEAGDGAVTAEGNTPNAETGGGAGANNSSSDRAEETVNYEISKKIKTHIHESGGVKKLSVAVMLDGKYTPAAEEGQEPTYEARTDEEIEKITKLVKNAIGFNQERGDSVEIVNMKFAPIEVPEVPVIEEGFMGLSNHDIVRLAEALIVGVLGLLMLLLVIKPMMSKALEGIAPPQPKSEELPAPEPVPVKTQERSEEESSPPEKPKSDPMLERSGNDDLDRMIKHQRVEGEIREASLRKVGGIIEQNPDQAVNAVRTWMYEG